MSTPNRYPVLKPLHPDSSLIPTKLALLEALSSEVLIQSLVPGQPNFLKTRPDGTILNGHHRLYVLRKRGIEVESLPREIVFKEDIDPQERQ